MTGEIGIRPATVDDAAFIAEIVAMAIGDDVALKEYCGEQYIRVFTAVASEQNTQYSWQNVFVAECDGKTVGAGVGYDGALLSILRERTLSIVARETGRTPVIVDETEAGEYYLDSLGVLPEYRGKGIASQLVLSICNKAKSLGHQRVGLIVDEENPQAERLYSAIGFECVGKRVFFGHRMRHLQKVIG